MKIVFLDQATVQYKDELNYAKLQELGEIIAYPYSTPYEALERIQDAEVLILNKFPMKKEIIAKLTKVKLLAITATGYDNIDIQAARAKNIAVANVPAYSSNSVAQLALTFILALATQLDQHLQDIHGEMKWDNNARFRHKGIELAGKTLGIIGFGAIGQKVARMALSFDLKIIAYTPNPKDLPGITFTDIDSLAAQSDFVSIHCPLKDETRNLITESFFKKMKKSAYLINTARGAIVNEHDLIAALLNKTIAGAGIDVLTQEPPDPEHPFYSMKNVLLTPHIAWAPIETRQRLLDEIAENIKSFFAGKPRNIVN